MKRAIFLTVFIGVLLAGGQAFAGIWLPAQTLSFSGTPDFTKTLTFDKFDGSLGSLVGVKIDVSLSIDGGKVQADNDGEQGGSVNMEIGATGLINTGLTEVDIFPAVAGVDPKTQAQLNVGADEGGDGPDFQWDGGADNVELLGAGQTDIASSNLAPFLFGQYTGAGETFDIVFDVSTAFSVSGVSGVAGGFTPVTSSGFVSVQYEYQEPSEVPAPAALWLLGSGLLGLAGFRKKLVK